MQATPSLPVLRRVPPGAWAAVIWCAYTVYAMRVFVEIPRMPVPPWAFVPYRGVLLAAATIAVLAGSGMLRRRSLAAFGLLLAGSIVAGIALGSPTIAVVHYAAIDVALGFIVATRSRRSWVVALVMALAILPGYWFVQYWYGFSLSRGLTWQAYALMSAVAWLIGNSVRRSRDYARTLTAQAATQAVTAERLRISRELHDMVAHSIGIIALQAGAANRVIDTQPERARNALNEVELASRETLSGLRRMLGALRQAEPGAAPLDPAPGLADVERLAAATTAAGVHVDVRWQGRPRELPPDIDLSAFRIIQESITNVVRHAGTRSCQVSIGCRDEELSIEVTDGGQGAGTTTDPGYGLAGMRERVALLHGDFTAEPRPEGGFRVTARLPLSAKALTA